MKNILCLIGLLLITSPANAGSGALAGVDLSDDNRVAIGDSIEVGVNDVVENAVSVGGQVDVRGKVTENAVAVGGDLVVHPGAVIEGDAVAVGGQLRVLDGATVVGDRVGVRLPFGDSPGVDGRSFLPWLLPGMAGSMALVGLVGWVLRSVLLLVAALFIAFLMPTRIQRVSAFLSEKPGISFVGSLAILFLTLPAVIFLTITIVGIPLVAVVFLFLIALFVIGYTAMLTWLGERLPFLKGRTPVLAIIFGTVLFMLIGLIPFFGGAFLTLLAVFAAGATLMSRFGSSHPSSE